MKHQHAIALCCSLTMLSCIGIPRVENSSHPHLIQELRREGSTLFVQVNKQFKQQYLLDDFFVSYDQEIDLSIYDFSILSMPFILNVISIIWISGKTYMIKEMDTELYDSLQRVKKVFHSMYPHTKWEGELIPEKLVTHTFSSENHEKAALLFSGGIDSVASALKHRNKQLLLITAWGHWDLPLDQQEFWHTRFQKITNFAFSLSQEVTSIRSNYTSMLNYRYLSSLTPEIPKWRLGAVEGLGWAGLTAPLLLSKGTSTLHIASSHTWDYPYPSAANPFIDNNLRFCGIKVLHDQFEVTRPQKIAAICSYYEKTGTKKPFLKVCSYEKTTDKNCLSCRKCLTTLACFDAWGYDPEPYGLPLTHTTRKKIFDLFNQDSLNYYSLLIGKELQNIITERLKNNEQLPHRLNNFLAIDFSTTQAIDIDKQKKLTWRKLIELLPPDHGLAIPSTYTNNSRA